MVQEPSRRCDQNIYTLGETLCLRPAVSTTHDEAIRLAMLALGNDVFANTVDLPVKQNREVTEEK
jgi:hypothetical protein